MKLYDTSIEDFFKVIFGAGKMPALSQSYYENKNRVSKGLPAIIGMMDIKLLIKLLR
jgi:hypothetical protein